MSLLLPTPADPDVVRRARRGPRRRYAGVVGGLGVLLLGAVAARVLLGDYTVTAPDFFRILFGEEIPVASFLVMESKLPRAVMGALVGVSLGAGGAVFQTLLRNPLASPDVIGVSMGASVAAITALVIFGMRDGAVSVAAVLGAVGVSVLVRWVSGGVGGYRLVLIGVAVSAALVGMVHYVLSRAVVYDVQLALRWLTGSLNNAGWDAVRVLALALLVLLPVLAWLARAMPAIEMGDDAAAGLGVPRWHTDALLGVAVLLVACGVAAAGPVAFVSFMAGPIARALNRGRTTVVGAALVGATLLVAADYAAAYLLPDVKLPAGVVTGAVGGPFLLWLLARGATGRSPR